MSVILFGFWRQWDQDLFQRFSHNSCFIIRLDLHSTDNNILFSTSCLMCSNSDWARKDNFESHQFFSKAVQTASILSPAAISKQSGSWRSLWLGNQCVEGILNKCAIKPLSLYATDYIALLMELVTFHLNAFFSFVFDYFHCVMPNLLGCKTTCFCSDLIWGEHFQLRILRTGKFLCTFWELPSHTFRLILTVSREKKVFLISFGQRSVLK